MNRHYYISDSLEELEQVEQELESSGISTEQIHVLSDKDADIEHRQLHGVPSVMKTNMVHSGLKGVLVGLLLAVLVLAGAYWFGWTNTFAGWVPFLFLALVVLGFSIWEGGFFGIQESNRYFRPFHKKLHEGKHVFFVDVEPTQEPALASIVQRHPALEVAGTGGATPHWLIFCQQKLQRFRKMI